MAKASIYLVFSFSGEGIASGIGNMTLSTAIDYAAPMPALRQSEIKECEKNALALMREKDSRVSSLFFTWWAWVMPEDHSAT